MQELNYIRAYVEWLLESNRTQLGLETNADFNRPDLVSTFAFGLAEEAFEVAGATTDEQKLKEVGDVVAYYCLLSVSLLQPLEVLEQDLYHAERQLQPDNPVADYLGVAKRFFRGDATALRLLQQAYAVLRFVFSQTALSLLPVLEANKRKLEARLQAQGTFHGSGDR